MDHKAIEADVKNYKIREGPLYKRSKFLKEWRERWIVLTTNYLYTFTSKSLEEVTDILDLKQFKSYKSYLRKDEEMIPPGFKIRTADDMYYFCAKNCNEKWSWLVTLERLMDYKYVGTSNYNNADWIKTKGFQSQTEFQTGKSKSGAPTTTPQLQKSKSSSEDAKKQVNDEADNILKQLEQQQKQLERMKIQLQQKQLNLEKKQASFILEQKKIEQEKARLQQPSPAHQEKPQPSPEKAKQSHPQDKQQPNSEKPTQKPKQPQPQQKPQPSSEKPRDKQQPTQKPKQPQSEQKPQPSSQKPKQQTPQEKPQPSPEKPKQPEPQGKVESKPASNPAQKVEPAVQKAKNPDHQPSVSELRRRFQNQKTEQTASKPLPKIEDKKVHKKQEDIHLHRSKIINSLFEQFRSDYNFSNILKYATEFLINVGADEKCGYSSYVVIEGKTNQNKANFAEVFTQFLTNFQDYEKCENLMKFYELCIFQMPGVFTPEQSSRAQIKLKDMFNKVQNQEKLALIIKNMFIMHKLKKYNKNDISVRLDKIIKQAKYDQARNWAQKLRDDLDK